MAMPAFAGVGLPATFVEWLRTMDVLHQHQAALLGLITHRANQRASPASAQIGQIGQDLGPTRDAEGRRYCRPRTWRRGVPDQRVQVVPLPPPTPGLQASPAGGTAPAPLVAPREKRRRITLDNQRRERVEDAMRVARHISATQLAPPLRSGGTAAERLASLRERVQARARAEEEWLEEQRRCARWPS